MTLAVTVEQHKKAAEVINRGIDLLLEKELIGKNPSSMDLLEVLDILQYKIHETVKYVGIPFFVPVSKKAPERTEHEFKKLIIGEMKELLIGESKYTLHGPEVCHKNTIKLMVSPILNRLSLFSHDAAISASSTVINKAKDRINPPYID